MWDFIEDIVSEYKNFSLLTLDEKLERKWSLQNGVSYRACLKESWKMLPGVCISFCRFFGKQTHVICQGN